MTQRKKPPPLTKKSDTRIVWGILLLSAILAVAGIIQIGQWAAKLF